MGLLEDMRSCTSVEIPHGWDPGFLLCLDQGILKAQTDFFLIPKAEIGIYFLFPFPACVFKGIKDIQDALIIFKANTIKHLLKNLS